MSQGKLREPKIDRVFRAIFPAATQRLEQRRYRGMANLPGIIPVGVVTDESEVEYYTDKVQRATNKVEISELEAKSAIGDLMLKRFGTALFVAMMASAILCIGLEEVFANTQVDLTRYANITMTILGVAFLNGWLFTTMRQRFQLMDQNWGNNIDSFYGTGAKRQMEAVRDCMREFKRFLKWRRYMKLVFWIALLVLVLEIVLMPWSEEIMSWALSSVGSSQKVTWSIHEQRYTLGFVFAQLLWLGFYRWMYVYYTTFRDPTLHMAVLVNVMDRLSLQPIISQSR